MTLPSGDPIVPVCGMPSWKNVRVTQGPAKGVVREWHSEQGWGVLDSPQTPGGCWCLFAAVSGSGFRSLAAQEIVEFVFEEAEQDGYAYRAVEAWSPGHRDQGQTVDDCRRIPFSALTIHVEGADPPD